MSKVTIDRELLEHMRNFTVMHDSGVAGVLRGQIDAILANPAQQGEAVEVAQVVSYLSACADGYDPDAPHPGPPEPLMTVAQHQRILAAATRPADQVAEGVVVSRELLENCADYMMGSASARVRIWHDQCRALLASAEGVKDE